MPSIFDNFLTQVFTGDNLRDYRHATRLFLSNNYELAPKYTWLFHVYFDLNPELTSLNQRQQIESGMLVKSTDLPRFRIDTKVNNNYNRACISQTKIKYEDINITFHDDSANTVRKLWFDYFNYYYRDMDNNYGDATGSLNPVYLKNNKQVLGQRNLYNKFGFSPRKNSNVSNQYIQAIRIYSFHQKRFSEYTILNPIISAYRHGTHQNGQDGTLENSMTIQYEAVLYAGGFAKIARGFADLHYDKAPSPLTVAGGGTNSILGPGGIVNAANEIITDGSNKNFGSALFKLGVAAQTNQNVDFTNLATAEGIQALTNILRSGDLNGALNSTYIPYRGVNADNGRGFQSMLNPQTSAASGSVVTNGLSVTSAAGFITGGVANSLSGIPTSSSNSISGLIQNSSNQLSGSNLNKIINTAKSPNGLTATGSDALPTNSFAAGIQAANERKRSLAASDSSKSIQETLGSSAAFLSRNFQNVGTTFTSGTNNVISQASSALANTPYQNFQFPGSGDLASQLSSINLNTPSNNNYTGGTSTNPIPT